MKPNPHEEMKIGKKEKPADPKHAEDGRQEVTAQETRRINL